MKREKRQAKNLRNHVPSLLFQTRSTTRGAFLQTHTRENKKVEIGCLKYVHASPITDSETICNLGSLVTYCEKKSYLQLLVQAPTSFHLLQITKPLTTKCLSVAFLPLVVKIKTFNNFMFGNLNKIFQG
jgi:hypothetical protein